MNRMGALATVPLASLCLGFAIPAPAVAQGTDALAGTWTLVSSDKVSADGNRAPTLGANPTGRLVLTADGRFIWLFLNADLPKFASNNRAGGTSEENAAIVHGSIAAFGTYALAGKDLVFSIEQSTFANWRGAEQKRTLTKVSESELKWTNPVGSTGGVAELLFTRVR